MKAKVFIEDIMYGRRRSRAVEPVLYLLSLAYGLAVQLRMFLYRIGVFRQRALPCRVISVGNVTVGGTGKTPTVIAIASLLRDRGRSPVVLSRGYGRKDESEILVVSDGQKAGGGPEQAGDEPLLMAAKLPGVPVVVGANRYEAGRIAIERFKPGTIVLDDGFQHRGLRRDLDIVLLDGAAPFGNGKLLPAGILRERLNSLRRAQAVIITRLEAVPDSDSVVKAVRQWTAAEIFTARHRPVDLVSVDGRYERALAMLHGAVVFAFAGIAKPASFFSLLASLGARVTGEVVYPDHAAYTRDDLAAIYHRALEARATIIVTTEKDGVKLRQFHPEGIWALRIELEINEREQWETLIVQGAGSRGQRAEGRG